MGERRDWTAGEIATLREHAELGARVLAAMLDRTERSVRSQASHLGLTLRRAGETRGRRTAGLNPDALAALRARREAERAICPVCVTRPIEVKRAGTCTVCYQRELARQHRDTVARESAARDLDAARQEKHRTRRRKTP